MSNLLDVLLAKQDEYGALFDEARERDDFDAMMDHLEKMRVLSRIIADMVNPRSNSRRVLLMDILIRHQRQKDGGCSCGWDAWGESFAAHVADAFEDVLQQARTPGAS
jgi:hypothetical protein